jgi:CHAT domain-containing protein
MKEDWKASEPLAYQQRYGMERQSLSELQQGMAEDQALLSYFIGEQQAFVFAITQGDMQTFAIDASDLPEMIGLFNTGIDSSEVAVLTTEGYRLYQRLLEPAASVLKGKRKLSLVADGPLESLPFEALLTRSYEKKRIRLHKLPYLIKEMAVEYRHTATSWKMPAGSATAAYEFLFVSPVFDQESIARIPADRRVLFDPNFHNPAILSDRRHFKLVAGAPAEASDLQVIWGESEQEGRFKLREAATENLVMQEMGRAHYLHLATYSFVEGASPEEAGLILANTELGNTVANDGFLFASELGTNPISATDLLSVNFVEMGKDADGNPIPILPFSGSCMLSGIPHILYGTQLHGESSFFPSFYKYLLESTSISESLQQVKVDFAKDKATAAPRWWAGYRLLSN